MYRAAPESGLASLLASRGRNGDSVLVHMSPEEVEGLHKLALATGGSLTLNPHTGLPEASWLSNLLPSIASAALNTMFPGLGSVATSAIVAAGSGLIQGSFEKGLKSGLQAYGTAQTMTGLKASAEADRAAKVSKLEELKKTVGADQISKPGPMDIFSSEYQRPTAPIATVRTPDIQAQIDKLTKEVAVPPKTGLAGLWQGVKGLSSTAGGEAFMRSLEGGYENPYLRSASQKAAIAGILAPFAKEPDQSKSSPMEYYIPGAKNPLYGTGRDQPYYLPGYYTKTPPKFADGGVIPAPNKLYPMGNIRQPGYAVPFQYPQASETLGGYDTAVDPFTGEESKPQVNFADGGQVDDFLTKLNQQVTTPTPFAVKPPTAGPEGLHIYQAPYKEGWVPPSGIKEYYQALLSPPAGGRDTSALRDYLDNLNKQFTKPTGPTGPTGPKTCPVGQHLNLQTMQCEDDIVPPPPPPPQDCPTGTYKDPSGNCLPIGQPPTECPSGKVRNPATGKCDDPAGPCPKGSHMEMHDGVMTCEPDTPPPPSVCPDGSKPDPVTGKCKETPPPPPPTDECPKGYQRMKDGTCKKAVVQPDDTCPDGSAQVWNQESGQFECPNTPPPPPPPPTCPDGSKPDPVTGKCKEAPPPPTDECPPGYQRLKDGTCKKAVVQPDDTCPDGSAQVFNEKSGQFECPNAPPPPPTVCGPGKHLNTTTLECEDDVITPPPTDECPPGYQRMKDGTCKKAVVQPDDTCPDGSAQVFNEKSGQFECPNTPPPPPPPPTCPDGSVFDPVRVECVRPPTPPPVEECKPGYERDSQGNCKKAKVTVEECGAGQVMTTSGCVDEDSFEGYMERYGKYLPLPVQLLYEGWLKLKKGTVTAEEFKCRGGADPVRDTRTNKMVCPEDLPSTGGDSKDDPRDLYRGSVGYDYGCPDPSMTILLANGGTVTAGDLKIGDVVRTKHEKTLEWGNFEVTHKEIVDQPKAEVILDGGDKKVIVSTSHKFWVDNEKNWVYTTELTHGDVLSGHILTDVKHLGTGPVVKITVKDAHTYVMEGLWSHNIKVAYPSGPKGSVIIEDEDGNPIIGGASGGQVPSGLRSLAQGGMTQYAAAGKLLHGPGDGMSDDIYANIGGRQEARLADGEFVVPADVVSHIGNGSTNAGAKKLYKMMADIRRARTGRTKQAPAIRPDRYMPRS